MSAGFTPGPWSLDDTRYRDGYGTRQNVLDAKGSVVLSVPADDVFPVTKANARLIAAAPQLYEALSNMVQCFGKRGGTWDELLGSSEQCEQVNDAMAALAQARGDLVDPSERVEP